MKKVRGKERRQSVSSEESVYDLVCIVLVKNESRHRGNKKWNTCRKRINFVVLSKKGDLSSHDRVKLD